MPAKTVMYRKKKIQVDELTTRQYRAIRETLKKLDITPEDTIYDIVNKNMELACEVFSALYGESTDYYLDAPASETVRLAVALLEANGAALKNEINHLLEVVNKVLLQQKKQN